MRRAAIAAAAMMVIAGACGGGSGGDSSPDTAGAPPGTTDVIATPDVSTNDAEDTSTEPAPAPTEPGEPAPVATEPGAPDPTTPPDPTPTALAFGAAFEACLTEAAIPYSDQISSIFVAPANPSPQYVPVEPAAVYGPPDGIWWAVVVGANAQDAHFLTWHMPTYTPHNQYGRTIVARGALTGWSGDETIAFESLPADQVAQLDTISGCATQARESDTAFLAASAPADPPATLELAGEFQQFPCPGPNCEIITNEARFTVPNGTAAGTMTGTGTVTIEFDGEGDFAGCRQTVTRQWTWEGTLDETPEGKTSGRAASSGFFDAMQTGATAATDPSWPGRVLADGTFDLTRTVTPEGCDPGSVVAGLTSPFVGYYVPSIQLLSGAYTVGPAGAEYVQVLGDM